MYENNLSAKGSTISLSTKTVHSFVQTLVEILLLRSETIPLSLEISPWRILAVKVLVDKLTALLDKAVKQTHSTHSHSSIAFQTEAARDKSNSKLCRNVADRIDVSRTFKSIYTYMCIYPHITCIHL